MHFLARLIHGKVAVAEELARDEQLLHRELAQFLESFKIKDGVLEHLMQGEPIHLHLHKLNYALSREMHFVEDTERTEHEILGDLKYLSRESYIKRLNEVLLELQHARMRDELLRHVLSELHDTLMSEARKVKRLVKGDRDPELRDALVDLLTIERHLVEKLSTIEDFQRLFGDLFVGTRRKEAIASSRKRLQKRIRELMQQVEVNKDGDIAATDDHYISKLTARVFNKLEDAVMEAVKNGYIRKHPTVDVEFVNSELFDRFVDQELAMDKRLGRFIPTSATVNSFRHIFREMYNTPVAA